MKKIILSMAVLITSISAQAATPPNTNNESREIITPEIATGFYRTEQYTYDNDLNILICPRNRHYERSIVNGDQSCTDGKTNENNKWIRMENIVPKGKKFVGFKSLSQGYTPVIEIYWK